MKDSDRQLIQHCVMDYKISIIIPAYNIEKYIKKCVISCIKQSYKNIEIIAINDGSVDNTSNILVEISKTDNRIIVINKENGGVASAREVGVKKATGDYLFFLDGDDYIPENAIELLIKRAKVTEADIVVGDYAFVEENGTERAKKSIAFEELNAIDFLKLMFNKEQLYLCFKLIKKSLYDNIIVPEHITLGEDAIAIVQVVRNATLIVKCDNMIYYYFRRKDSVTKTPKKEDLINAYHSSQWIVEFIEKNYNKNSFKNEINRFQVKQLILYLDRLRITGDYRKDIRKILKESNFKCIGLKVDHSIALKLSYFNVHMAAKFLKTFSRFKVIVVKLKRIIINKGKL